MLGGALLALSVFLPWYGTDSGNRFAKIDGARGDQSCWEAHPILRWLLLAAAVAPFILAYIIATDTQLSWARGEMTMVISIAALGLIFYNGVIDRPGAPSSAISVRYGLVPRPAGVGRDVRRVRDALLRARARAQATGNDLRSRCPIPAPPAPTATSPSSSCA